MNAPNAFMEPPDTLQKLVRSLTRHGDKTAVFVLQKNGVETRLFTELVSDARRLAAGLAKHGLSPGAHVLVLAPNSWEWLVACFALLTSAAVPVVVDTQMSDDDLRHVLRDSETAWGVTTSALARRLAGLSEDARMTLIVLDADNDAPQHWRNYQAEDQTDPLEQFPVAQPTDPAVLFYTSGTTGAPKGVPLSHRNLMANLHAFLDLQLIRDTDRFLLPVPLHHVYAFTVGMLGPLTAGASLVFPRSLTGPQIVRALRDAQVTVIIGVPRFYAALYAAIAARVRSRGRWATTLFSGALALSILLRRRLGVSIGPHLFASLHRQFAPCLRAVVSGGAALETDLAWKLEGLGWQTASGYGLTETSPILTFNPPGAGRIGTVGRPLPGVHLKIAAAETPSGQGEVQAKGPNVFAGYWRLPEQTRAAFTPEGYFRTGDVGYFDEDGYLHLVGRASSMLVMPSGENVWPEQIEEILAQSEHIREAGVLEQGGRLVALIVPKDTPRHAPRKEQEPIELIRSAVERQMQLLPSHHRIADYAVTFNPLPRTHLGKLRRYQLADRYTQAKQQGYRPPVAPGLAPLSQLAPEDQVLLEDRTARAVWDWLGQRFPRARITPDAHLRLDLDVDSLAWLNLTLELREQSGLHLTEEAIGRIETVRDLLREAIEAEQGATIGPAPVELLRQPEALLSATQRRWLEPPGASLRLLGRLLSFLNRALMRWLFKLQVRGLEQLPPQGPFVLTPNHVSLLDPPALAAALPEIHRAHTYWGGWTGIMFTARLMRLVSRAAQVVPVDAERGPLSSLAFGVAALMKGKNLVWFPEGGRSRSGALQRFRPGIGLVVQARPAPIIPVWIAGTFAALPYGRRWPRRHQITITFGRPVTPEELQQLGHGAEPHERIAEALYRRVAALSNAESD